MEGFGGKFPSQGNLIMMAHKHLDQPLPFTVVDWDRRLHVSDTDLQEDEKRCGAG